MQLLPEGVRKIAVVGSAPDTVRLAPYDDPSWAIWGCSPGAFAVAASKRSTAWFETHRYQPSEPGKSGAPGTQVYFSPEFHAFLQQHPGPVMMSEVHPGIPHSTRIPFESLLEKYGPYHFTSSISLMLAMAIDLEPEMIGLWGVDMSATSEYAYQRPGCQHFIGMAVAMGIKVILPPESDLMRPPVIYGLGELEPRHMKLTARLSMFEGQRAELQQQQQHIMQKLCEVNGVIGDIEYMLSTWSSDIEGNAVQAFSLSSESAKKSAPESAGI